MMTSVENIIDAMLSCVKKKEYLQDFAFIPGYPAHKTPNPVTKYTVAVVNNEVTVKWEGIGCRDQWRVFEVLLTLRVYAPEGSSGSALLRASSLLMNALESTDPWFEISEMKLSGIGFDTASRTEYRDVIVKRHIGVKIEDD